MLAFRHFVFPQFKTCNARIQTLLLPETKPIPEMASTEGLLHKPELQQKQSELLQEKSRTVRSEEVDSLSNSFDLVKVRDDFESILPSLLQYLNEKIQTFTASYIAKHYLQ